eukprot:TRINITY_DN24183_c0_g1_i1.p1 TRINITY_DN24183_c0_g1~~TRINITY_DN24183_c0_g1_i1.p1  ORF type:complete len:237 (-),score=14.17 TRINITY_DN24183_c0_g1_i1:184-861(-)
MALSTNFIGRMVLLSGTTNSPYCLSTFRASYATKVQASTVRKGDILLRKGKLLQVVDRRPAVVGRESYVQMEFVDLQRGVKMQERLRTAEHVEIADLDVARYTYSGESDDGKKQIFRQEATGEELEVDTKIIGDVKMAYLQEDMSVAIRSVDDEVIGVELPSTLEVEVADTTEVDEGKSSRFKPAKLDNGRTVKVPPFIKAGDRIVLRTEDEAYLSRVVSEGGES